MFRRNALYASKRNAATEVPAQTPKRSLTALALSGLKIHCAPPTLTSALTTTARMEVFVLTQSPTTPVLATLAGLAGSVIKTLTSVLPHLASMEAPANRPMSLVVTCASVLPSTRATTARS